MVGSSKLGHSGHVNSAAHDGQAAVSGDNVVQLGQSGHSVHRVCLGHLGQVGGCIIGCVGQVGHSAHGACVGQVGG